MDIMLLTFAFWKELHQNMRTIYEKLLREEMRKQWKRTLIIKLALGTKAEEKVSVNMKHAIYRADYGGYYSWEYIDKLKDCKNILGGYYLTQEDLPIIVNSVGGHCSFSDKDKNFVKIVECPKGQDPLTREQRYPKNSDNFEYGWIDLEGNTYNCGHEGHSRSARYICEELGYDTYRYEKELEDRGWVKVTGSWNRGVLEKRVYSIPFFITKKQADTLFDLGLWGLDDVKILIHCSELSW